EIPDRIFMAVERATSGRPGPVILDVPLDLAQAEAPEEIASKVGSLLVNYRQNHGEPVLPPAPTAVQIDELRLMLSEARRPVLMIGGGVLWSSSSEELRELAERLGAPVT